MKQFFFPPSETFSFLDEPRDYSFHPLSKRAFEINQMIGQAMLYQ